MCTVAAMRDGSGVAGLAVRWLWRLRLADSSIFPRVTNGNLNAPSIMVGEKAADHILGRAPLAPMNERPWINPRWRESDR